MSEAEHIDLEDEYENDFPDECARRSENVQATKDDKPLLHEVDIVGATGTKNAGGAKTSNSKKPLEESFGVLERNAVDMEVMKGLCANAAESAFYVRYSTDVIRYSPCLHKNKPDDGQPKGPLKFFMHFHIATIS
ncbi:hypothetical protein L2E82_47153 [Cichorium intybus]|uniref:Uncharacterized protein n=1 Tax=Cichorium intybus TaxID=13427 RepID=A0ACB8YVA3_CICIN|nr:hypothetical protein L2E82_47153 [Cichorium intybus]